MSATQIATTEEKETFVEFLHYTHKEAVSLGVNALYFKDGEQTIMYIPSLKISSHGNNRQEAYYMMKEIELEAFFEDLFQVEKSEAMNHLFELGWEPNRFFRKKLNRSEAYINTEGILQEFDLPTETEIEEDYIMLD